MKNRKRRNILVTLLMILVLMFGTLGTSLSTLAATVTADSVNVRNAPTTEGDNIIGSLSKGANVTILDEVKDDDGNDWYYIMLENGNTGYVRGDMIDNGENAVVNENTQEEEEPEQPEQPEPQQQEQQQTQQQETQEPQQQEQQQTQQPEEQQTQETQEQQTQETQQQETAENTTVQEQPEQTTTEPQTTIDEDRKARISSEDYDPTTDKEARYGIQFLENTDGTGQWYVYNYDTGSKVAIGDLQQLAEQEKLAADNAARAARLRTILIILVVLLVLAILFILWMIFFNGRTPAESRMAAEKRRRIREQDKQDGLDYQDEGMIYEDAEEDPYGEDEGSDYDEDYEEEPAREKKAKGPGVKGFFNNLFAKGKQPAGNKKSKKQSRDDDYDDEYDDEYDDYGDDLDDLADEGDYADEGYADDGDYADEGDYDDYAEDEYVKPAPSPRRSRRTLEDEDDDMDYDFMK